MPLAGIFISAPYDVEARYAKSWVGYTVHATESCDDNAPHLMMHVETMPGLVADSEVAPRMQHALARKDVLPDSHLVDTGCLDADTPAAPVLQGRFLRGRGPVDGDEPGIAER